MSRSEHFPVNMSHILEISASRSFYFDCFCKDVPRYITDCRDSHVTKKAHFVFAVSGHDVWVISFDLSVFVRVLLLLLLFTHIKYVINKSR